MGKRIGKWCQAASIYKTASEFVDDTCLTAPYCASIEIILNLSQPTKINWVKSVASLAQSYPNVEVQTMCIFDLAEEGEWDDFDDFSATATNVDYIGMDCEHCTYGGDFPDYSLAEMYSQEVIDEQDLIDLFDQGESIVTGDGKTFVNYYMTFNGATWKASYSEIGHTNFPCAGDPENTLDWYTDAKFKGISSGLYAGYCTWTQSNVNAVIEHTVAKSDAVRRWTNFAVVEANWTSTFKNWIWTKMQTYEEGTFIIATGEEAETGLSQLTTFDDDHPINSVARQIGGTPPPPPPEEWNYFLLCKSEEEEGVAFPWVFPIVW